MCIYLLIHSFTTGSTLIKGITEDKKKQTRTALSLKWTISPGRDSEHTHAHEAVFHP